jgi:hypothetical protein
MPRDRKEYLRRGWSLALSKRLALRRVTRKRDCNESAIDHFYRRPSTSCALRMHVYQAVADPVVGMNEPLVVGRLDLASQVRDVRAQRLSGIHVRCAPNLLATLPGTCRTELQSVVAPSPR